MTEEEQRKLESLEKMSRELESHLTNKDYPSALDTIKVNKQHEYWLKP